MNIIREFFMINRTPVLFVYGLTFFMMGVAIFLNSRRFSRLRLARDLYWLAAFGILHGLHEWGYIFIPIQATYMPQSVIYFFEIAHTLLLAASFLCLLMFGMVMLYPNTPRGRQLVIVVSSIWLLGYLYLLFGTPHLRMAQHLGQTWSRYLLCLPGGLLAAYGLWQQSKIHIVPLNTPHIHKRLQIAAWSLVAYAIFAGLFVQSANFFPANLLNRQLVEDGLGVPIEVLRSVTGMVLAITTIRALEIFEIEVDRMIETMEVEQIQRVERERIGQDIHDGAIQGVYSASLILESLDQMVAEYPEIARRVRQAKSVLGAVNTDLRSYMVSLRAKGSPDPLIPSLQKLIADPRFQGILEIDLQYDSEPILKPMQVHHLLAIVQESLSNTIRHARAHKSQICLQHQENMFHLHIEDDGFGFNESATQAGYGLRSIRDRARLIGGQVSIESTIGRGTRILLSVPEEKEGKHT